MITMKSKGIGNRRTKFCNLVFALVLLVSLAACSQKEAKTEADTSHKFWVWLNPSDKDSDQELEVRYKKYYDAGVKGIFFEADNERHYRIAKKQGLETHRWMWIMNRGESFVRENHPEWFAVNRKGESSFDKPAYVDYYRWLCPSRPEVVEYLKQNVENTLKKEYVDGIHLDYIRFCDVVLPVNLWAGYGIVQTQELPEYDYCYCDVCKAKFKNEYKQNLDSIEFPDESMSWRKFRYDAVNNVVAQLSAVAKQNNKAITAAVFPTPEEARRNVRQDWTNWDLTAVYPMIYHGFYREPTSWIGTAVAEGVKTLNGKFPLYAGVYLPDFKDMADLKDGIKYALDNGAAGVSLFGNIDDEVLKVISEFK